MELRLIVAALCLLGVVHSVPLNQRYAGACSQHCTSQRINFNYQVGRTYVYNYDSVTRLNAPNQNDPGVRIVANIEISVLTNCEFALQLRNVRVQGLGNENEYSRALEQFPLLFSYDDGRVNSVCPSPD
ncbi:apolipophorin-like protein, partial [Dinothrombium tinctorium]